MFTIVLVSRLGEDELHSSDKLDDAFRALWREEILRREGFARRLELRLNGRMVEVATKNSGGGFTVYSNDFV